MDNIIEIIKNRYNKSRIDEAVKFTTNLKLDNTIILQNPEEKKGEFRKVFIIIYDSANRLDRYIMYDEGKKVHVGTCFTDDETRVQILFKYLEYGPFVKYNKEDTSYYSWNYNA